MEHIPFIAFMPFIAEVIAAIVGMVYFFRLEVPRRIFTIYLISSVVCDLALLFLIKRGQSNLWIIRIFSPLEFGLLAWMFLANEKQRYVRRVIFVSIPAFVVFCIANAVMRQYPSDYDSLSKTVSAGAIVALSTISLISLYRESTASIVAHGLFWISLGLLIHSGISIVMYAASNQIAAMAHSLAIIPWEIRSSFDVIAFSLCIVGLFKAGS